MRSRYLGVYKGLNTRKEGKTMDDTKYNGWTNYETWLFNLHFDDYFADVAQEHLDNAEANDTFSKTEQATLDLADHIKQTFDEYAEQFTGDQTCCVFTDLINEGLSSVNHYEIAKHYIEDNTELAA